VSEALPGVTPDTKRTVLWGNGCAAAAHANAALTTNIATRFIDSSSL
jgi:predicted naringenin-chalcone synthase